MDVYCKRCGEPFELCGITDDFTDEEKKRNQAAESRREVRLAAKKKEAAELDQ